MNKLYFGDTLEILREMDDERIHLICTDPPLNLNLVLTNGVFYGIISYGCVRNAGL